LSTRGRRSPGSARAQRLRCARAAQSPARVAARGGLRQCNAGRRGEDLESRAREHGVAVLDLRKALEPVVNARGFGAAFFVHVEARAANPIGHMNPSGNRIAGEAIAAAVRALPASGV